MYCGDYVDGCWREPEGGQQTIRVSASRPPTFSLELAGISQEKEELVYPSGGWKKETTHIRL